MKVRSILTMIVLVFMAGFCYSQTTINYGTVNLAGGYQKGHFIDLWDLTQGDMVIKATLDMNGLVDDAGAHAWSELGIRQLCYGDFNPTFTSPSVGVWLATDYDWTANTFDPDPPNAPNLDMDDKFNLQRAGGLGEGSYDLPGVPPNQWANHRFWFDRDGVDQWQALSPLAVDGKTYNTNGIYHVKITLHATGPWTGEAYMRINTLDQGFEVDGNWNTMELTPAGETFSGDMSKMQVFYGLYGYGATHSVVMRNIEVEGYEGVEEPPIVDFIADTTWGITELCVQFKNLTNCGCKFLWDFGDGFTSTEMHPRHCYNDARKHYTVTLTAYNDFGQTVVVKENFIKIIKPTDVAFNAYPIAVVPGAEVQFMNNCGGVGNHFLWDYGDGSTEMLVSDVRVAVDPKHVYTEAGCYGVSLMASGAGGEDMMTVPELIYVDPDFAELELLDAGETVANEGWDNAIDHDIISTNADLTAMSGDAWGIFGFADETIKEIHKIRLMANNADGGKLTNHLTQHFELWVSMDGVNFTPGFIGDIASKYGWEVFEFDPVQAMHIKLVLYARGEDSPYVTLGEFQIFGKTVPGGKAKFKVAGILADGADIAAIPEDYGLLPNYPNPFNPETAISYQLPEAADVILSIYNVQGQLITTLVNERKEAGTYQVSYKAGDIAGGIYIYKIITTNDKSETFTVSRKMTLLK